MSDADLERRGRFADSRTKHVTIRISDDLLAYYDRLVDEGVFPNRSVAMREGLAIGRDELRSDGGDGQ